MTKPRPEAIAAWKAAQVEVEAAVAAGRDPLESLFISPLYEYTFEGERRGFYWRHDGKLCFCQGHCIKIVLSQDELRAKRERADDKTQRVIDLVLHRAAYLSEHGVP